MGAQLKGLANLEYALKTLTLDLHGKTKLITRKSAELISEIGREYAPVDEHRLEDAFRVKFAETGYRQFRARVYLAPTIRGRYILKYARVVHEYPWERRGPKTRKKGAKAGPGYMRRAFRDARPLILDMYAKQLATTAKRAAAKGRARSPRTRK